MLIRGRAGLLFGAAALVPLLVLGAVALVLEVRVPRGAPQIVVQVGHSRGVTAVAFSPDGEVLASASQDGTIKLWEVDSGALLATLLGHSGAVNAVAFRADGKTLASAGQDGTLRLWDAATGTLLRTMVGHTGAVTSVAAEPGGGPLASGGEDGTIRLWEPGSGTLLRATPCHAGAVTSMAFSPDGAKLASAGTDSLIALWDVAALGRARSDGGDEPLLRPLRRFAGTARSVAFSRDGRRLASAGTDGFVNVWDARQGALVVTMPGHSAPGMAVAFGPGGGLASAGEDGLINLWDTGDGRSSLALRGHAGAVATLAISPNGQVLASGGEDRSVRLWDLRLGRALRELSPPRNARDPLVARGDASAMMLDGHSLPVLSVAFSPDGRVLASASVDASVKLWDAERSVLLRTLSGHLLAVTSVAFSPDGKTLASASFDRSVRVWDVGSGKELAKLDHPRPVTSVAFSPDGRMLASGIMGGPEGGEITLWDVQSRAAVRTFRHHAATVTSVAFSPDGRTLGSGSEDLTVRIWDIASGDVRQTLRGHSHYITSVAFSPDGLTLASASIDTSIRLWGVRSGAAIRTLSGHAFSVLSVAYSPDGRQLASASVDRSVRIWDARSGAPIRILVGSADFATAVAYSPSGKRLASAGGDGIKVWEAGALNRWRGLYPRSKPGTPVAYASSDGTLAMVADDGSVTLWNGRSDVERALRGTSSPLRDIAFSPNLEAFASSSEEAPLTVGALGRGSTLAVGRSVRECSVWSLAFAPGGKMVAAACENGRIALWSVAASAPIRDWSAHDGAVLSVAFSPDGAVLASAGEDGLVQTWDVATGGALRTFARGPVPVGAVAFSPSGDSLATGSVDGSVKLWSASDGALTGARLGQSSAITSLAFSPDGKLLAATGADGSASLWNERGAVLPPLAARFLAFKPHGAALATSGPDGMVTIWDTVDWTPRLRVVLFGDDWIAWSPATLRYASSSGGDHLARVRFGPSLRPMYPLEHYRSSLGVGLDADEAAGPPRIAPSPLRLAWELTSRQAAGAFGLLYVLGNSLALVLALRRTPAARARRFFEEAGYPRIRDDGHHVFEMWRTDKVMALVIWWNERSVDPSALRARWPGSQRQRRLYVLYDHVAPEPSSIHQLRHSASAEVIPLPLAMMARALAEGSSATRLQELEEPYFDRDDPYDESRPVDDPNWFYGREEILSQLCTDLARGQHAGLFGLRKIGKTSVLNQLRGQIQDVPIAWVDCQGYEPRAEAVLGAILAGLESELRRLHVHPRGFKPRAASVGGAREELGRLVEAWRASSHDRPFIVILDEVDKLLPDRRVPGNEPTLKEFVRLFRALRAEGQERRSVALLVTAHRPDINKQNVLSAAVGENPMFMAFKEYYLGNLSERETKDMIRNIGRWKDIEWEAEALDRAFESCAGHPLLTRLLASDACERGSRKRVHLAEVSAAIQKIQERFRKHRIGDYYRESVWDVLHDEEREVLQRISSGLGVTPGHEEALARVERFGLVSSSPGGLTIAGALHRAWLEQRAFE